MPRGARGRRTAESPRGAVAGEFGKPFGRRRADWLSTPGMHEMWAAAASTGQAMCGLVNVEDLGEWEAMVVRYPATTVVIDHFCRIGTDGAPRDYTVRHTPPLPTPSLSVATAATAATAAVVAAVAAVVPAFLSSSLGWHVDARLR